MKNKRGEGKDGATISTSGALECTKSKSKLRGAPSLKTWCSKERRVARAALTSGSNTDARRVAAEQNAEVTGEPSRNKKTRGESGRVFIHTSDFSLWGIDRRRQFGRVMRCDLRPSLSKLSLGRATTQNPEYVVATRVTRVLGGRRRRPDGDHATSVEVSLAKRRTWEARPRAPRRHSRLIQAQTSEASRSTIQAHNASKIKNKKFSAVLFRYFPRSFAGMDPPTA